jgi:hypothetical protein
MAHATMESGYGIFIIIFWKESALKRVYLADLSKESCG